VAHPLIPAEPDPLLWSRWALVRATGYIQSSKVDETEWETSLRALLPSDGADQAAAIGHPRLHGRHLLKANGIDPQVTLMVSVAAAALKAPDPDDAFLACVLDDDFTRTATEAERVWNGFLRLHNLFQFLRYANFATRRQVDAGGFVAAPAGSDGLPASLEAQVGGWEQILSLVAGELRSFATRLGERGDPLPILGFELTDELGAVIAEAELGWPELRIALLREDQRDFLTPFKAAGWGAFVAGEITNPEKLFE
jgi:DEAD/DEAH box helicase domain-containing protein